MRWQVQEAKQRFSEVLRAAATGEPQIVTRHGEEIAVIMNISDYRRLRGQRMTFLEFLRARPILDEDLDIERGEQPARDIDLGD